MASPTLHTARLRLEPYVPADEDAFIALFDDAEVSRWIGNSSDSDAENRALFRRIFKVYETGLFDVWAVRRGDRYVGHAEIKPSADLGGHEIVYALARSEWGSGLGTELARAIVAHGFDALALAEVFATVVVHNKASLALLGRLGFEHLRDIEEDGTTISVLRIAAARPGTS